MLESSRAAAGHITLPVWEGAIKGDLEKRRIIEWAFATVQNEGRKMGSDTSKKSPVDLCQEEEALNL